MDIQVILTENDPKLGKKGQVVKVSSGYAQNYLFPNHKALPATASNLKTAEQEKSRVAKHEAESLGEAKALGERIRSAELKLEVMAGDGDKLFGAVTAQDLSDALANAGIPCDRKKIHLQEPIKKLGLHEVEVKLHPSVSVKLRAQVVRKS